MLSGGPTLAPFLFFDKPYLTITQKITMLKRTLAFGLLATIGLAVPAQAQNAINGSQSIHSQTVGVNGSHVVSNNDQDLTQVLLDNDFHNLGAFPEPNVVIGNESIGSASVGANYSSVFSNNAQDQTNVLIDNDANNSYPGYYPYYPYYPGYPQ